MLTGSDVEGDVVEDSAAVTLEHDRVEFEGGGNVGHDEGVYRPIRQNPPGTVGLSDVIDVADGSNGVRDAIDVVFGDARVAGLRRLTGGASRETWRCTVDGEAIVAQVRRDGAERDMHVEAAALRAACAAGVPAPRVIGCVDTAGGATTLFTGFMTGETIARKILRDEEFASARSRLTVELGRALARVHRIDGAVVPGIELVDPVASARQRLDEIGEPHPTFELAFRWLREHSVATVRATSVVHGDFRLGNLIVDSTGLAAVIDWELVHLGDPMEDLGWLCAPAWRFGSALPAAGVGTREQLIEAYTAESGIDVDLDALRWWEVSAILRWGVICMSQADFHRTGVRRSHELAAIGRRVCETEFDLFSALEGEW